MDPPAFFTGARLRGATGPAQGYFWRLRRPNRRIADGGTAPGLGRRLEKRLICLENWSEWQDLNLRPPSSRTRSRTRRHPRYELNSGLELARSSRPGKDRNRSDPYSAG